MFNDVTNRNLIKKLCISSLATLYEELHSKNMQLYKVVPHVCRVFFIFPPAFDLRIKVTMLETKCN